MLDALPILGVCRSGRRLSPRESTLERHGGRSDVGRLPVPVESRSRRRAAATEEDCSKYGRRENPHACTFTRRDERVPQP